MNNTFPIIEFRNVSKLFGECQALSDCSFSVAKGSIHGIVGENGAGKSTAMKILFGMYKASSGQILVNKQIFNFSSPIEAMNQGIGMVHQHFMLAEPLSALDNILLFQKNQNPFALLPRKELKTRLQNLAKKYGFQIDLEKPIEDLSVGEQQRVEILKVLAQESEIIILDEPTAVLTPQEVLDLFSNLRQLKNAGKTILIITHKLKEIKLLTDSITVFRAGKTIANLETKSSSIQSIAEAMVGRNILPPIERTTAIDYNLIQLETLESKSPISNFNMKIHSKEIVGIAGVEGNGQQELIQWLYDYKLDRKKHKHAILHFGAFPEDRLRYGALPNRPVFENFILGRHHSSNFLKSIFFDSKKIISKTMEALEKFDVRPKNPMQIFDSLSGGNQQKLIVARELLDAPDFVLAAQPTRGVDIGAIEFIHNQLKTARDRGAGILLVSSELDELMALSDRILVIYKKRIVANLERHEFDEIKIGEAMGGGLS